MRSCPAAVRINRAGSMSLQLRGDIDAGTASEVDRDVRRCLRTTIGRSGAPLVIDCSDVTFMDTRGLASLLRHGARVR